MPHQDALDALTAGKGDRGLFLLAAFHTGCAERSEGARGHVVGRCASAARARSSLSRRSHAPRSPRYPKLAEVVAKAIDEASAIIGKDPRRAAVTWLKYEPSHTLDARAVEAILRDLKDEFGSGVFGVECNRDLHAARATAEQTRSGAGRTVVAPAIAAGPGS